MLKFKILGLALLTAAIFALFPSRSYAQETVSLGFAPTNEYITLEPGEVYEGKFTVWNLKEDTNTFYVYVSGFEQVENYPGTAVPLSREDDKNDPYSASSWITIDIEELDVVPQKNYDISYTITVPEEVALGEYHVKIFLSTDKTFEKLDQTTTFTNLASGPNFLLQIGETKELNEDLDLLKFYTDKHVYEKPPVNILLDLQNTGNTHIAPKGDIVLTNIFGTEIARIPFNHAEVGILRGQTATYENLWGTDNRQIFDRERRFIAGPVNVRLIMTYKTINPGFFPITSETTFWIIPWKLIFAILGVIALFITGFKMRKRHKKK